MNEQEIMTEVEDYLTIFLKYVIIDVAINFCGDIGRIFYVI